MNKHIKFLLILSFLSSYSIAQIEQPIITTSSLESIDYFNTKFKFKVSIPNDWRLHDEKEDGRKNLTIQWLLPKTYDSIQNEYINSTIYIKAFRNKSTKSVDDMLLAAYLSIAGKSIALSHEPNIGKDSRILYMDLPNGDKYKGKVYFKFNNGVAYRITYQTTQGTYENNLKVFENFISSFKFK